MSPARFDRADVAHDLRRGAAVGALDQGPRRRPPDAAVAHRPDRRHPEIQERSLAHRRADRDDRPLGRRRRAAGRSERHARRQTVARRSGLELRGGVRPEGAGPDHQVARLHHAGASQDAWDKRITPSGITEPRWVRAIEIRPETLKGRKITHHAIAYLEQTEPGAPAACRACRRRSWSGRSASRAR